MASQSDILRSVAPSEDYHCPFTRILIRFGEMLRLFFTQQRQSRNEHLTNKRLMHALLKYPIKKTFMKSKSHPVRVLFFRVIRKEISISEIDQNAWWELISDCEYFVDVLLLSTWEERCLFFYIRASRLGFAWMSGVIKNCALFGPMFVLPERNHDAYFFLVTISFKTLTLFLAPIFFLGCFESTPPLFLPTNNIFWCKILRKFKQSHIKKRCENQS